MARRQFYRSVIQVAIFTDRPWTATELTDLGNVDYETDEGAAVGQLTVVRANEALEHNDMARALRDAGSSMEFFLAGGDDDGDDDVDDDVDVAEEEL